MVIVVVMETGVLIVVLTVVVLTVVQKMYFTMSVKLQYVQYRYGLKLNNYGTIMAVLLLILSLLLILLISLIF